MHKENLSILLTGAGIVVCLVLWLVDKSGKNTMALTIVSLVVIAALCLWGTLLFPWIWNPSEVSLKIWRAAMISTIVLLAVSRLGIWLWPQSKVTNQAQSNGQQLPSQSMQHPSAVAQESASEQQHVPSADADTSQENNKAKRKPHTTKKETGAGARGQQQQNSGGTNIQQSGSGSKSPNVSAPYGIAIGGDNRGIATVNNYGPIDRHLNPATANALSEIAKSIPNKDNYPVGFLTVESGEAETFADEIALIFYKQGIGAGRAVGGRYWSPQTPRGVIVCVKSKDAPAFPLAEKIANALSNTSVPAVGMMINPNMNNDRVLIVVGERTDGSPVGATTGYVVVR